MSTSPASSACTVAPKFSNSLMRGLCFVAVQHLVHRHVEVGRAGLRADQQLRVGGELLRRAEAALVRPHQHELLRDHVRDREVDLLSCARR